MPNRSRRFTTVGGDAVTRAAESSRGDDRRPAATATSEFERRKHFAGFGAADAAILAELGETFESHADALVERFYEHLTVTPELQPFLTEPGTVARLKRFQRAYLVRLASGRYDEDYAEDRRRIGEVHERIGLEPQWFIGTYGLYADLLGPIVHRHFSAEPERVVPAVAALHKLLMLDMQLVLDVYHETRERRVLGRSEQLAAVGELAASIAHEVRNPLAGMKGALQVLRAELVVKPSNAEIVDELLAQIVRLEQLVRDLLTFARPRVISPQEFDLHDLLDRLLRGYKEATDAAGITVRRSYAPGTGSIVADLQQLEQVFHNLIQNAVQAMEQGGTLTVATSGTDAGVEIGFSDTGKGIAPSELSRIFQPFYTTKHRGSGLGLPIVKKILEAHGGTVEVSSEPGRGTATTLRIPFGRKD